MITELPDICIRKIFDFLGVDGLINCYEAIDEWKPMILQRLAKIKYLLPVNGFHGVPTKTFVDDQLETISFSHMNIKFRYDENRLQNLLPNLKIFSITREMIEESSIHAFFIWRNQSIRGLVFSGISGRYDRALTNSNRSLTNSLNSNMTGSVRIDDVNQSIRELTNSRSRYSLVLRTCSHCPNIEFIAADSALKSTRDYAVYGISTQIKQLYQTREVDFGLILETMPNLIRFHASTLNSPDFGDPLRDYTRFQLLYARFVLQNLEILEIHIHNFGTENFNRYGFKHFNFCPALKSVYLQINNIYDNADVVATNHHMQDLVLSYSKIPELNPKENAKFNHSWSTLRTLLIKFPNLKHLAIRDNTKIKDGDIRELIEILPNLALLDLRGSNGITRQFVDYITGYCARTGRSIKIYIDSNIEQTKVDWPNLSTDYLRVCKGFDFMKHCFLKPFKYLPYFLIPEDR